MIIKGRNGNNRSGHGPRVGEGIMMVGCYHRAIFTMDASFSLVTFDNVAVIDGMEYKLNAEFYLHGNLIMESRQR